MVLRRVVGCALVLRSQPEKERATKPYRVMASVVEDNIHEGTMYLHSPVIVNEAKFAEFIHEEADPGACRTHNLGQCLLAHLWDDLLRPPLLSEVGQKEQHSRKSLLTGIEEWTCPHF